MTMSDDGDKGHEWCDGNGLYLAARRAHPDDAWSVPSPDAWLPNARVRVFYSVCAQRRIRTRIKRPFTTQIFCSLRLAPVMGPHSNESDCRQLHTA